MKFIRILIICILSFNTSSSFAQDTLKLEKAIALGLQNNFSIQLAKNDVEIADNNNSIGNAGYLPVVTASANQSNNMYGTKTEVSDGTINESNASMTNTLSANIMLNWTVFDGFAMIITKEKLEEYEKISKNYLKLEIENLVSEISALYYSIVQQQIRLKILENAMNFSNKRKELAQAKFRLGSASELNYLQALVDLNSDSTALIRQITEIKNSKAELNHLLARNVTLDYLISDSVTIDSVLNYVDLIKDLEEHNSGIMLSQSGLDISLMNYRLSHSPKYPEVNFFAGYNFSKSIYETGSNKSYQYMGPVFGIGVSYTIFNGFNKRRNSANTRIEMNSSEIQLKETISQVQTTVYTLYNNYLTNLDLVKFETENIKAAQRTTFVAYERYKLGEISDIELRQTQLKELEAQNQLLNAQYQAKLLETELLRLSGKLVK